jgi:hypothetical protein
MVEFSTAKQLTPNNAHHFFGYFGIPPWSQNGRYFVCLESSFQDHMPELGETAKIMLLDLQEGTHRYLAETKAWNFQQGSMMHWLPSDPNRKIIYNDCDGKKPISRVLNIETGESYALPRAINAVGRTKDIGLCVSFARLRRNRRVTSYACSDDFSASGIHPSDDGVYLMDLKTGESKLILSINDIWTANPQTRDMNNEEIENIGISEMWFNHLAFNFSDSRFFFLARYTNWYRQLITSMWTASPDGSDPYLLVDFGTNLSHFEWLSDSDIMVTMKFLKETKMSHVKLKDKKGEPVALAPEDLIRDGHPTISPNKKWLATDCYPVDNKRHVYLVEMDTEKVHTIHTFDNPSTVTGELRCDPHCRWSRDSTQIAFDAITQKGDRQVFTIDIEQ